MLANMIIGIGADVSGLVKGLGDAESEVNGRAKKIGSGMASAGKAVTMGLSLPLLAVGGYAIKASMDFNAAMGDVASLIPGNTKRVAELKKGVQELAMATGVSTDDLAKGLYQVTSAFGDTADSMAILKSNAIMAKAGLATTSEAIALTSAVTKAYGDTSKEAVKGVSDLSLMTVRLGQTTLPELAGALPAVTALTSNLNVSQQELFATMATATGVTGNAAEVATQMKGAMSGLMAPTDSTAKLFKGLGYESGAAAVKGMGFQGTLAAIVAESKKSGKPLQEYLGSIEGQTLALGLSGSLQQTYAKNLKQMGNAAGATDAAFREQTTGMNANAFTMAKLKQQVQVAAQTLGDALAPALGDVLTASQPLMNGVTKLAQGFANMSPAGQKVVLAFAAIAVVLPPLIWGLGSLITALTVIAPVASAAWVAITGPVGLVVLAIAAVVAAGVLLYKNWDLVKEKLAQAWEAIKSAGSAAFTWLKAFIQQHAVAIAMVVTGPIGALVVWLYRNWDMVKSQASTAWASIKNMLSGAAQSVASGIRSGIDDVVAWVNNVWNNVKSGVTTAWSAIKGAATSAASGLATAVESAIDNVVGTIAAVWSSVRSGITSAWAAIISTGTTVATNLGTAIQTAITALRSAVVAKAQAIGKAIVDGIIQGIRNGAGAIKDAAANAAKGALDGAKSLLRIKSPSQVFADEVGAQIVAGMVLGMQAGTEGAAAQAAATAQALADRASRVASKANKKAAAQGQALADRMAKIAANTRDRIDAIMGGQGLEDAAWRLAVAMNGGVASEGMKAARIAQLQANFTELNNRMQRDAKNLSVDQRTSMIGQLASIMDEVNALRAPDLGAGVPELATGGIASGPTLAKIGEYPGANANPEVVAPLDKLAGMMGGGNGVHITITGNTIARDYDVERIGDQLVKRLRLHGVSI